MKHKKILITGAGFLGSNLARRLLDENNGNEVTLFIRKGADLTRIKDIIGNRNLKLFGGGLTDYEDVKKALIDKDYLFHLAWQTDLKKSMEDPLNDLNEDVGGLLNILEVCKISDIKNKIKIIFASTVTVIGFTEHLPSNELTCENPLSVYETNKLMAEKYLQVYYKAYGIKSCVLRLANVFGEYQKIDNPNRGVLNFMVGRALRREPLTVYGNGDFIRDYCYVQNYIDAFILAAESSATDGEVFVLGSGEGKTFNEVVQAIKEIVERLTARQVVIEHINFSESEHEINKRNFIADFSKFRNATGWYPKISFDGGLRRTIGFYYNNVYK